MKTLYHILGLLLYLLQPLVASGQNLVPKSRFVDFRVGLKTTSILDQNTSHLVYRSNLPLLGARWTVVGNRSIFSGSLMAGRGNLFPQEFPDRTITFLEEGITDKLNSVVVPMQGKLNHLRCSIDYLRKVNPAGKFATYLGGRFQEEVNYSEGFVTPGLMNTLSIAPTMEMQYFGISKSHLSVGFSVPIAALSTRSAYHNSVSLPGRKKLSGFLRNGTNLVGPSQHREINIYARYFRSIGEHIVGGVEYNFNSIKNYSPRTLNKIDHEINLTLRFSK